MPKVVDAARVTTRDNAVWRTCAGCSQLAALPPELTTCPACTSDTDEPGVAGFTARELSAARATLTDVCRLASTPGQRRDTVNAFLTGYLGGAVTAAVAGQPGAAVAVRRAAALYAVREQVIA
jgi:hypothetical protein